MNRAFISDFQWTIGCDRLGEKKRSTNNKRGHLVISNPVFDQGRWFSGFSRNGRRKGRVPGIPARRISGHFIQWTHTRTAFFWGVFFGVFWAGGLSVVREIIAGSTLSDNVATWFLFAVTACLLVSHFPHQKRSFLHFGGQKKKETKGSSFPYCGSFTRCTQHPQRGSVISRLCR